MYGKLLSLIQYTLQNLLPVPIFSGEPKHWSGDTFSKYVITMTKCIYFTIYRDQDKICRI